MKERYDKIKSNHKLKRWEQQAANDSGWNSTQWESIDDAFPNHALCRDVESGHFSNAAPDPGEPQRTKTFLEKLFSKLGFGVLLLALFLLALSPAVFGYVWFGDRNIWSFRYLQLMEAHPFYFHRTLLVAALFAFVYATTMAWLVLKIKKFRKQIFVVLFVGSFSFSIYVCNWLLEQQIITYWSW